MRHISVLQKEVIKYLDPKANENFIDATFGQGGHSSEILKKNGPNGKVLGIEIDSEIFRKTEKQDRLVLINSSYTKIKEIVEKLNFKPVNGILFDLGLNSWHIDESGKGFSFRKDEPLDMRYNPGTNSPVAETIINEYSQQEIESILKKYGEERFYRKIAKNIIEARKTESIKTTFQLVDIIKRGVPLKYQTGKINPATRTFQALRIAVNDELNNLEKALSQINGVLSSGARIVVISFHSLEDRIVKNFFKSSKDFKILTKKPVRPSQSEIRINPRSRSAKLRAAIKI